MTEAFLIDSNSFISSFRQMYSFKCFPSFWDWLKEEINKDDSKLIVSDCVYNELYDKNKKNDELSSWVENNIKDKVFNENKNVDVWQNYKKVIDYLNNSGYYGENSINNWSQVGKADPLLIAIAMTLNCKIITFEAPSGEFELIEQKDGTFSNEPRNPNYKTKKEPKIPDVAQHFGVECLDLYYLENELGLFI